MSIKNQNDLKSLKKIAKNSDPNTIRLLKNRIKNRDIHDLNYMLDAISKISKEGTFTEEQKAFANLEGIREYIAEVLENKKVAA
jgi:hypothetical protein